MVTEMTVQAFSKQLTADPGVMLVDVRTPAEFRDLHARGAINLPLDTLSAERVMAEAKGRKIAFICKSGGRSAKACSLFGAALGDVQNVQGGTDAWVAAGLPVKASSRRAISLERQVRIAAGSLVLLGIVLGAAMAPGFYGLSAFVGAGLIFAGLTDWCGMAMILARMPWNR